MEHSDKHSKGQSWMSFSPWFLMYIPNVSPETFKGSDGFLNVHKVTSRLESRSPTCSVSRPFGPWWALEYGRRSKASHVGSGGFRTILQGFWTNSVGIWTSLGGFELNWSRTWRSQRNSHSSSFSCQGFYVWIILYQLFWHSLELHNGKSTGKILLYLIHPDETLSAKDISFKF